MMPVMHIRRLRIRNRFIEGDGKGPIRIPSSLNQEMMSSIPGLFAAGDVRNTPFRQIVVGAGEGAVAAHCAAKYIDELKGEAYE